MDRNKREQIVKKVLATRDRARSKLLTVRVKLKRILEQNERKTELNKTGNRKSLNPTFVALMPPRKSHVGKNVSTAWSGVPSKPRYSSVQPKKRLYGGRFEAIDAAEPGAASAINKPRRL